MVMLKALLCALLVLALVEDSLQGHCSSRRGRSSSRRSNRNRKSQDNIFGGSFNTRPTVTSCKAAARQVGRTSKAKVYYIINGQKVRAVCDTSRKYDNYDWLVIQRRVKGDVNFQQNYRTYTRGFGRRNSDFWLGLENIHQLTKNGRYILKIELMISGKYYYATYKTFNLLSSSRRYVVKMGGYTGTAGNSFSYHCGRPFYTYDKDNKYNCSRNNGRGGWWYRCCYRSNLNGVFRGLGKVGLNWYSKTKYRAGKNVRWVQMKIRKI